MSASCVSPCRIFDFIPHTAIRSLQLRCVPVDGRHCFVHRFAARLQPVPRGLDFLRQALHLLDVCFEHFDFCGLLGEGAFAWAHHGACRWKLSGSS